MISNYTKAIPLAFFTTGKVIHGFPVSTGLRSGVWGSAALRAARASISSAGKHCMNAGKDARVNSTSNIGQIRTQYFPCSYFKNNLNLNPNAVCRNFSGFESMYKSRMKFHRNGVCD